MEDSFSGQVQVNIEEYKTLTSEIASCASHQNTLFNWALVVLVGVSSFIFGYPTGLQILVSYKIQWVLLLVPFIFIAISFDYQLQYFNMTTIASYINLSLRPRLCTLLQVPEDKLLAWEDYLDSSRRKSGIVERVAMNARNILILLIALWWLIFFVIITRSTFKLNWEATDIILFSMEIVAFAVILYSNILVVKKFRKIRKRVF